MHLARFPRVKLCHAPTALEFMPNLTKHLGGPQLASGRRHQGLDGALAAVGHGA